MIPLAPILSVLGRVPAWAWIGGALLSYALINGHRAKTAREEFSQAKIEARAAQDADALVKQAEANRQLIAIQEAADAANLQSTRDRAAAAAAAGAAGRLRERVAALQAAAQPADPAAAERCKAAIEAGDVLANLFRRADERAGELAAYADAARTAGEACEASYSGLRQP